MDPYDDQITNQTFENLTATIRATESHGWKTKKELSPNGMRSVFTHPEIEEARFRPPTPVSGPQEIKLKQKLLPSVEEHLKSFDSLDKSLAPYIFNYNDLLFSARMPSNASQLRDLYSLHALNHILKTRDHVLKNNGRLAAENDADLELRDQGFTRPKIMVMVPTREACFRLMHSISKFYPSDQQENKARFVDSFHAEDDISWSTKSEDFRELFGGNDDDSFRLGIKVTRKTIKYFAQFYNSDIIIGSPLGLRLAIDKEDGKKEDYDFLSSIEVAIVDQTDALGMQNWEHVDYVFDRLNLQPKEAHGCDFSRVHTWYLDGLSKYARQTIVLSSFNTPNINALFSHKAHNLSGKAKITPIYDGAINNLHFPISLKQVFLRFDAFTHDKDPDARFQFFTRTILSSITRQISPEAGKIGGSGILIFVPSYLDFIRLRNYFATSTQTENISFGAISEYTSVSSASRTRSHFMNGKYSVLLYTERAHHFRRYRIKNVKQIVMYGVPENPTFYQDLLGYIGLDPAADVEAASTNGLRAMYSKWDAMKMERIVGSRRIANMMSDRAGDTFTFL